MFSIQNYLDSFSKIHGWCEPFTAEIMHYLAKEQQITGDILEIGIHHGKSFIPIASAVKKDEKAIAVDVFENQDLNIDKSGLGDRHIFEKNLTIFLPEQIVQIKTESSINLSKKDFDNNVRLVSIDGGHTEEITFSDICLASSITNNDDALVFLDDIFNKCWPGVKRGFDRFIAEYPDDFAIIALIPNKLVLGRAKTASFYRERLKKAYQDRFETKELWNQPIDCYF